MSKQCVYPCALAHPVVSRPRGAPPRAARRGTPEAQRLLLFVMAGLVGAATAPALSATFTVTNTLDDGSAGSLRWAVAQANANPGDDTINFDSAVFATPRTIALGGTQLELTDTSGATTIAAPAAGVTVDAGGQSRVLKIDALVTASISGMTITGGSVDTGFQEGGGGVFNQGTLSLTNCAVTGNSSTDMGGGLSMAGSSTLTPEMTLTNCTVSGNTAFSGTGQFTGGQGGGVFNSRGTLTMTGCAVTGNTNGLAFGIGGGVASIGPTTVMGCTFSGNRTGSGGGMWAVRTATITDCTFTGNYCQTGPGGGLLVDHCTATVTNCIMTGNRAGGYVIFDGGIGGGGLGVSNSTLIVSGCTIRDNHSVTSGGGVAVNSYGGGDVTLDHCTVSGNSSEGGFFGGKGGGGVAVNFTTVTLTDCLIRNNSTTGSDGGGGVVCSAGDARLIRCTVSGNTAGKGAGVSNVFFQYYYYPPVPGSSTLTDCTVSGNTASGNGGGFLNDTDCTATVTGTTVNNNSAAAGGGISSAGPLTMSSSTINNNRATSRGGGIAASGCTATLTGSQINSNQVTSSGTAQGGGIGSENTSLSLTNCQINSNQASGTTAQGGGIFALTSTIAAGQCNVNGNRATGSALGHGGGIYSSGSILILQSTPVKGNKATSAFDNIFDGP